MAGGQPSGGCHGGDNGGPGGCRRYKSIQRVRQNRTSIMKAATTKKAKAETADKLDIELKKVRHYPGLSRETEAFTAEVWLDGKKWATAEDDGGGGAILVRTVTGGYDEEARVDALCRTTYPRMKSKYFEDGLEMSLEIVIGQLLSRHIFNKKFRRKLAKQVLAIEDGKIFAWPAKYKPTPENCGKIASTHPRATVLNLIPLEQAFDLLWEASE